MCLLSPLRSLIILLLTGNVLLHGAYAESHSNEKLIVSSHVPMIDTDIPPVGHAMDIAVSLRNTINVQTKVRLVGSKDGRYIDLAFPMGKISKSGHPEYVLHMPAPLVAMSYQIIVHQPDGRVTTSKQFSIQRTCIEDFQIEIPSNSNTKEYKSEVASLVSTATRLEHESHALEQALEIVRAMETKNH
jgi:hypothetical protein